MRRLPTAGAHRRPARVVGAWWAHLHFTRINIELIILPKKFEDLRQVRAFAISADVCNQACVWGNECLTEPRTYSDFSTMSGSTIVARRAGT
jgi:hypothetical protein